MTKNLFDLKDKVAFVPGGYGGLGGAVAEMLAEAGARVAIAGRSLDKAQALAKELTTKGHAAIGLEVDAESVDSIRKATDAVAARFGRLDILANCVGKNREQKVAEVTEETFDEIYRTDH